MMSRRDYEYIASAMGALRWHNRHTVLGGMATYMSRQNKRFNREKFLKEAQYDKRYDGNELPA